MKIPKNHGESLSSQNTNDHWDCASQTSRLHKRSLRIVWNYIMAKLTKIILEAFISESSIGNLLRTDVHVFSDSVLCVGNHISEADQCNSIGTYVQATQKDIQTFLGATEPCDFQGRIIFMSMFNDI